MPYTTNEGARIYWEEQGSGQPLLLIMGLGYPSEMWYRVLPGLSSRYRTVIFDNRGVGKSDEAPGPYSIALMAEDSRAVMDAAGVEQAHVFGISMGGMIAQELALMHRTRVRALVLGCTNCGGTESVIASPEVFEVVRARATMQAEEGAWSMVPYIYDASTPRERVEEDIAIRIRTYPAEESYNAQLQAILSWGSFDRLKSITAPTLVIHGESDQLVPPENGRILAREIPGAELAMLPNASHIFPTDQPEASLREVMAFLERVDGGKRV